MLDINNGYSFVAQLARLMTVRLSAVFPTPKRDKVLNFWRTDNDVELFFLVL